VVANPEVIHSDTEQNSEPSFLINEAIGNFNRTFRYSRRFSNQRRSGLNFYRRVLRLSAPKIASCVLSA
jgi:hypothetical protein